MQTANQPGEISPEALTCMKPRSTIVHVLLRCTTSWLFFITINNDPVSALHHFKRCLALSPNGPHANEVKNSIKRDEIAALTVLSGDSVITRSEAARLRNENLMLHKELETRRASLRSAPEKSQAGDADSKKIASKENDQTYVVQPGDTLFSISRKFYNSPKRWKEILQANKKSIRDPKDLTVGQTLVIP